MFSMTLPHDLHVPERIWLGAPQLVQLRITRCMRDAAAAEPGGADGGPGAEEEDERFFGGTCDDDPDAPPSAPGARDCGGGGGGGGGDGSGWRGGAPCREPREEPELGACEAGGYAKEWWRGAPALWEACEGWCPGGPPPTPEETEAGDAWWPRCE